MTATPHIVAREKLQFGLDREIPRYWLGGDPFKTRFCDAMSTIFPEGERYFISCVRDFRDQVTDPQLEQEIKDFMRQEGQHGMIHRQFNAHLKAQGIAVDKLEGLTGKFLFGVMRRFLPKKHTLAATAAAEHLTSIMAEAMLESSDMMRAADPRMFALYAWHAMEEMEHKAVAFDVMQKVAKVWYPRRIQTLIEVTIAFNLHILLYTGYMLRKDGLGWAPFFKQMAKGLWWVYGPRGLFTASWRTYFRYYKPGYHPWHQPPVASYPLWPETFNRTGDPLQAGAAVHTAALPA